MVGGPSGIQGVKVAHIAVGLDRPRPAGLLAEVGLRWWRHEAARNRTEDLNVQTYEAKEAIDCVISNTWSDPEIRRAHHWRPQEGSCSLDAGSR